MLVMGILILTACGGGGSSGEEDENGKISKIILNADKTTIEANGTDSINFTVIFWIKKIMR